mgnify:CR=1 FL=1
MNAKLIILGCGSSLGVPRIDGFWGNANKSNKKNIRTRCSSVIIKGSNKILIDVSPDVRNQLLNNKVKDISSVILTHEHADQTNGLFELRPFFWRKKKRINIYGNKETIKYLKKAHSYLFNKNNDYPAIVKSNLVKTTFSLGKSNEKINFKTIKVKHGKVNCVGYIFEKTAYLSDVKDLSIIKIKDLSNLNYLIIDCLKYNEHPSHFNLKEVIYIQKQLKPRKTILTNLHHDLDYDYLLRKLPKNVLPGYDGLKLIL